MQIAERLRQLAPLPLVFVLILLSAVRVGACAEISVPPELRGWEDWALQDHESHRCPWLIPGTPDDESRICAWPSVLELQVDAHGGRFSQQWEAASDTWLPLPGGADDWPEEVTLDGKAAAVVVHEDTPAVRVAAGAHSMAGTFRWTQRPELLSLARSVSLVSLSIDGARVPNPQRTDAGIMLGAHALARQEDRADVRVFRRLGDGIPALLRTEIRLAIAGEAREMRLPAALPEGFQPTAIESALAARLDPDNTLHVQVRPGDFTVTIEARGPSPLAVVRLPQRSAPWPPEEVWSFAAEDRLRVVAIEGAAALDPAQANVPAAWRELPAYRVDSTTLLKVVERSRGLSAADGNDLRLERIAWLDFAGSGYTIIDKVSGAMRQDWRLDLKAPYALRSARTASGEPLLITAGLAPGLSGIELRTPSLDLTAVSQLEHVRGSLPATGWHTRFTSASGKLVMAPGYRLLAAVGPDAAPQAWLERWRLLDIFIVLLTATVAWRMFGLRTAIIALAAVALTYQETDAPTWLWLAVLIAIALHRAAPAGRLRDWAGGARLLALVLLLLSLIPFAITQVRLAVYPQLEALTLPVYARYALAEGPATPPGRPSQGPERAELDKKLARFSDQPTSAAALEGLAASAAPRQHVVVTAGRKTARAEETARYEPGALVQAGPGVPAWSYHVYPFSWSGPVEENATARFIISPPWMTRLWRLAGLLLAVLFLIELTRRELPFVPTAWGGWAQTAVGAVIAGVALLGGAVPTADAATTPDPALIEQLRTQLLAPPKCSPDCAAVLSAEVSMTAARLSVVLSVSTLDAVGVALPGAEPNWNPDLVQVDGSGAGWVQRSPGGVRHVRLAPGLHRVRIEGPLEGIEALSLSFPLRPHVIDVHALDWDVGGIAERRLVSGALELARRRVVNASSGAARQGEFPPYVAVDRLFHLSHDWTIDTTVTRVAPRSAAFTVNVPLLPEEAVTTPGLKSSGGKLSLGLAAGESLLHFSSILPRSDSLELVAPRDDSHSERWRFEVAPTWHAVFSGIPAVAPAADGELWLFEYYPRPGERLNVQVTRPAAAPGGTLAFDGVTVETSVGRRSSDTMLELHYRSTQGGRQTLRLPADVEVTRVLSDGQPVALRPEHGELSLSALPGTHVWSVSWRSATGVRLLERSPQVVLGAPASNLQLSMRLPEDRWVLYAFGPGVGPTILYWGELLLFIVLAWWIGGSALTPLPARDWLLLGLGLSTFSWFALALFAVFIGLFQWRSRHAAPARAERFKLLQLLSAFIAIVAIFAVVAAVPQGLLAHPDMRIEPAGQAALSWFVDQAGEHLPTPSILSISLWWYKLAMLAWALWLSFALTRWTRWAWEVFTRDGLWPRRRAASTVPPAAPAAPSEA